MASWGDLTVELRFTIEATTSRASKTERSWFFLYTTMYDISMEIRVYDIQDSRFQIYTVWIKSKTLLLSPWVPWVVHLVSFISIMNTIDFLLHRVTNKQIGKIFLVSIISMPTIHVIVLWLWKTVKMKVTQSCLTLCDPMDYTVHEILQAGILEW